MYCIISGEDYSESPVDDIKSPSENNTAAQSVFIGITSH